MPDYRYMLTDLLTGKVLSDAVAMTLSGYARSLCDTADCTGTLDLSDTAVTHLTEPVADTEPRRTALWIVRDGTLVWGGIIWTRRYNSTDRALQLTASTPESYFARRRIRGANLIYTQVGQHTIMAAFVTHAQSYPNGNIGITVPAPATPGTLRDRSYFWFDRASYLDRMKELADVDGGPDFTFDPVWTAGSSPAWAMRIGTPLGAVRNSLLEFPGDLLTYSWPEDGGNSANYWSAIGDQVTVGANQVPLIRDASMPAEWANGVPLLEDTSSHQGVTVTSTLSGYARANVRAAAANRIVPEASLRIPDLPDAALPGLGDTLTLRIRDPYRFPPNPYTGDLGLTVATRLTGWSVGISDTDGETVTLTLTEAT